MKRRLLIITYLIFLSTCSKQPTTPHNIIIFYRPYTGEAENNFFSKDSLTYHIKQQYSNLKNADVRADFDRAISRKDFRCIGISGYSYLIPGLDGYVLGKKGDSAFYSVLPEFEKLVEKNNFKVVDGTSDVSYSGAPDVQTVAGAYAEKYNRMMLFYARVHHIKGQ